MKETLAFKLTVLYKDFLAYTTGELKALGLNFGQLPVIIYTGKHPGCTQAQLTKALSLDWGYSQRSIAKLSDSGFLTKGFDREKNSNCLELTEKGKEAFEISHRVFYSWDSDKMQNFSEDEKEMLNTLLSKITAEKKDVNS